MRLHLHLTSPFAWKVMVAAAELGIEERLVLQVARAHPVMRDRDLVALNPLGQVPTLESAADGVLADSRVICEYLDALAGARLFPPDGAARWRALTMQGAADGMMAAAVAARYEIVARPPARRWPVWADAQRAKIASVLDWMEARADGYADPPDIGGIAAACALAYLDLRHAELAWREGRTALAAWHARMAARPSMAATRLPPDASETAAGWPTEEQQGERQ